MMNALRSPLCRTAVVAMVAVLALAMAGCTKKLTGVDPGYTVPEGTYSADAQLIVYPDVPIDMRMKLDELPFGVNDEDPVVWTGEYAIAPGTLYGMIMDGTPASAYQMLRRESNSGFGQFNDYQLEPATRFLESQKEIYTFSDPRPSGYDPPSYMGRGVLDGAVTQASPLTNLGELTAASVASIVYNGDQAPRDSNITMRWFSVTGAAGYWVQIYQSAADAEGQFLASQPAPFLTRKVHEYFVGYLPAQSGVVTSYKLGDPGAVVVTRKALLMGQDYFVRITAVNARGEMIAFSRGDWATLMYVGYYYQYRCGAFKVTTTR